jgi:1-acyl-sn-glycerol-3-phosphate acyltransferase
MKNSKLFYNFARNICRPFLKLVYRYIIVIDEEIPQECGFILASNHLSFSDPVLLGIAVKKRRLFFMAKIELFKNKLFGALIRGLGAFPVERGAGDGKAIKTGIDLIKDGEIMAIFIEGGRTKTGELMRPRSGCAVVAQQMQVPVIPACITIVGNPKHLFSKRVIHIGKAISPQELGLTPDGGRRELRGASEKIMGEIKRMREQDLIEYKKG